VGGSSNDELALEVLAQTDDTVRAAIGKDVEVKAEVEVADLGSETAPSGLEGNTTVTEDAASASVSATNDSSFDLTPRDIYFTSKSQSPPLSVSRVQLLAALYERTNRSQQAEQLWVQAIAEGVSTWADLGKTSLLNLITHTEDLQRC
jgi:hypothetical protein